MGQLDIRTCAPETSSEDLASILRQDGCLVLKNFLSSDRVDAIDDDLRPFVEATMRSNGEFGGFKTARTGALMARLPNCRDLAVDARLLGLAGRSFILKQCAVDAI